jgi:uncharacterized membrane protein YebE (DUF533 family)
MKTMDNSKFHMWRGTICAAYIDQKITPEEKKWLEDHLKNLPFDSSQKKQIISDLGNPPSLDEILPHITAPTDRSMLLHFANIIFHKDGDLDDREAKFHSDFTEKIMSGINLENVENVISQAKIKNVLDSEESNLEGGFGLLVDWFLD